MSRCSCRSCHPCRFPMRPLLKVFVLFGLLIWVTGSSKAQDKVEVYGGYSYLRASVQVGQHNFVGLPPLPPVTQHGNLNGWELAGQYKFLPFLGAVVDFNGNYGGVDGASTRVHTFLFGPQVSLATKVSPFAHALIGVAKESQENNFFWRMSRCDPGLPVQPGNRYVPGHRHWRRVRHQTCSLCEAPLDSSGLSPHAVARSHAKSGPRFGCHRVAFLTDRCRRI